MLDCVEMILLQTRYCLKLCFYILRVLFFPFGSSFCGTYFESHYFLFIFGQIFFNIEYCRLTRF